MFGVFLENHHMQDWLALLDRVNHARLFQGQHVDQDPRVLFDGQAAARQVEGNSGQVGGSRVSPFRCRVTVVTPQPSLLLHGAHQRIDLQWSVEVFVVGLGEILQEVTRPRPAVAPALWQVGCQLQRLSLVHWDQHLRHLVPYELSLIGDSWQLQAVQLCVLIHEHVMRAGIHSGCIAAETPLQAGIEGRMTTLMYLGAMCHIMRHCGRRSTGQHGEQTQQRRRTQFAVRTLRNQFGRYADR